MHKLRLSASLISVLFVASAVQAITYVVPTDRDLVRRADAIVVATALSSYPRLNDAGGVETVANLAVQRVLKGAIGEDLALVEIGGFFGDRGMSVPGSPRFEDGKSYLIFLRRTSHGGWATYGFGLGKFEPTADLTGRVLYSRGGLEDDLFGWDEGTNTPHVEQLRDAAGFLTFVETMIANPDAPARADYFVDRSQVVNLKFPQFQPKPASVGVLVTRPDYLSQGNFRWSSPTTTVAFCCTASGYGVPAGQDGPGAFGYACSNWTSVGTTVHYNTGANTPAANKGLTGPDGYTAVLFNDVNNEFAANGVPPGVAGLGGVTNTAGQYNNLGDGFQYFNTIEGDVVLAKNIGTGSQNTLVGVITHELGHSLGFRHSDQTAANNPSQPCAAPAPCAPVGQAVMASTVQFNLGTLQTYDVNAIQTVYGSGPPPCTSPTINTQPQGMTISSGQSWQMSVGGTGGTTPYTYQWYQGNPTGTAIGGQTQSTITVSPTTTTVYYVTVTSACGGTAAQSNTATVTVASCVAPSISLQPAASSSINSGQTVSLSMDYSGTTGTVTWYQGALLNRNSPVGTTKNFTSTALSSNTSFWAEIVNSCGSAQTSLANVTVNQPTCPTITLNPAPSTTISSGQNVSLSMGYTGTPGAVTWYQGALLNRNSPVGSGQNFTSTALGASTSFWAEIVNGCGSAQTSLANVTVQGGPCTQPVITLQPASVTIATGTSTQLFIGFTGTPGTITWYQGAVGTRTTPVGSGQTFNTPTLTANTTYWAEIINSCTPNGVQSNAATVTVTQNPPPCTAPAITTQPANAAVTIGGTASFTVGASGTTPLVYQWYQGAKGDAAKPVGTNSPSFTSDTITGNTSFWVRVTNTCNGTQSADSNAASVAATAARRRPVRH